MTDLSDRQKEVLKALIEETREFGPPTMGRLVARCGLHQATVKQSMNKLQTRMYAVQDYPFGPYRPIRNVDGIPLELRLVEIPRQAVS